MSRRRVAIASVLLLAVMTLAALPLLRDRESYDREGLLAAHPELTRSFAELSAGITHYEYVPGRGDLVVLVHGVSGPMSVWDETCRSLRSAGRAHVRLDLYGRGASARIDPPAYELGTFRDQVVQLVDRLAPGASVHLVGSSMGALVTAEVARKLDGRVRSLVLVGPAGFPPPAASPAGAGRAP